MAFSFLIVEKGKGKEKYTFKYLAESLLLANFPIQEYCHKRYIGWKKKDRSIICDIFIT